MLQACLNGARTKSEHPAVPYSPDELAADARAAFLKGATEFHVHPRNAVGEESLRPEDVGAALKAIRAKLPGAPVGVSTGAWIAPQGRARQALIARWGERPDYVSVNLSEEDAPEVMALAFALNVGVEAGLASPADARRFVALPSAGRSLRALIEISEQDERSALEAAAAIADVLDAAGFQPPRLLHGVDASVWPLFRQSLSLGIDARIGLEDGLKLPSGEIAKSNAELIRAARALSG